MKKNTKKLVSSFALTAVSVANLGLTSFAESGSISNMSSSINGVMPYAVEYPGVINKKVLNKGENIAWNPGKYVQPTSGGPLYSKVVYLTKLEAIAVAEGYRDSAFKSEFIKVLDHAKSIGSYAGGYLTGAKIVEIANKLGCKKVASFFSGVGGAIAVGYATDAFLNLIRYINYNQFKSAINSVTDNYYYVQIKVGISNGVPIRVYSPWNSRTVWGLEGFNGSWTRNTNI